MLNTWLNSRMPVDYHGDQAGLSSVLPAAFSSSRVMKFSTRIDVDEPAAVLFDQIGNTERLEGVLIERGATITRMDPARESATALGWLIGFDWRGRRRNLRLKVTRFDRPELIVMTGQGDSFDVEIRMSVVALSKSRSRLTFETDVRPRNMRARLMLQTAKLAKPQLDAKFARRVGDFLDQLRAA